MWTPLGSASDEGPTTGLTTESVENVTTAATFQRKEEETGGRSSPTSTILDISDEESTPLQQREPRRNKVGAESEASTSWARIDEEETMEVEIRQSNRNLSRAVSQESLDSMCSVRLSRIDAEGDMDSSGNEARSMVSVASVASNRTMAKASKRKRAAPGNSN